MPNPPHITAGATLMQGVAAKPQANSAMLSAVSQSDAIVARFERALFGVLHVMKRETRATGNAAKMTAYCLFFVDFLQVRCAVHS